MTDSLRFTVIRYYGARAFYTAADNLFGTVYVALLSSRNLSTVEIGLVLACASLALTVFDYPSGNVADMFGRKKTLGCGFLVWGAGLLLYAFAHRFLGFIFAMVIWSLGVALISGVPEAWFVDELLRRGHYEARKRYLPLANTFTLVLGALTAASSSLLVKNGIHRPITLAGMLAILAGVLTLCFFPENYGERGRSLPQLIWRNTREILSERGLRLMLVHSAIGRIPFQVLVFTWQLHAVNTLGMPPTLLGPVLTVLMMCVAAGNALAAMLGSRIRHMKKSLIGYALIFAGSVLLAVGRSFWPFLGGLILFELGLGLHQGAAAAWVHDLIPSERRASVISALSAAGSMMGLLVPTGTGYLIGNLGTPAAWCLAAGSTLCAASVLSRLMALTKLKGEAEQS